MRKSIALAIAAIGIGLTTNVFANAAGTQVSPSTINLSAVGVSEVGIHTQLANADCTVSYVEVTNGGLPSGWHVFNNDGTDLSIGVDSVGHLVITIRADAWGSIKSSLSLEETNFLVSAECNGDTEEVNDTAQIVDNSGVKK